VRIAEHALDEAILAVVAAGPDTCNGDLAAALRRAVTGASLDAWVARGSFLGITGVLGGDPALTEAIRSIAGPDTGHAFVSLDEASIDVFLDAVTGLLSSDPEEFAVSCELLSELAGDDEASIGAILAFCEG